MGAAGTAVLDFGSGVGAAEAAVDVTGQSGLTTGSHMEAFIQGDTTADHSVDEHVIEGSAMRFSCTYLSASSFRIRAECGAGVSTGQFTVHWATA